MRAMCAKNSGDCSGERRPFEGFLRGKPKKQNGQDPTANGSKTEGPETGGTTPGEQPFGFYRPDPEDEERDRVARRLWKQVFG
ncbi:MAG: hypothetical protein M3437_08120 [Chloroflexota bacterium]|nr:hypothetical protein [Chloroflexota bacterium]MDQ5867473.1 hypothetical protein [Chloroflexota bacterium]